MNDNSRGKSKRRPRMRGVDLVALLLILGAVALLISSGIRYVAFLRLDFAAAEQGSITIETPAELVLIRSEYLLTAAGPGVFTPAAEEGDRVSAGAAVGHTALDWGGAAGKAAVISEYSGLVSYEPDGWETLLKPDSVYNIDWQRTLEMLREQYEEAEPDEEVEAAPPDLSAGRVVAKITDNLAPLQAFICGSAPQRQLQPGDKLTLALELEGQRQSFSAAIETLGKLNNGAWICLADLGVNAALLSAPRYQRIALIGETISGLSIPLTAVFTDEQGRSCVYYRDGKQLGICTVEVLAALEGRAIVSGLKAEQQVLANPDKGELGQRLY